jgi:selenocysteine lyase/cysteine desulfurase
MDVDALRALTPGCGHRTHLNNAGAALMSEITLEAMTGHLRLEAEIGGYEAAAQAQDGIDATYRDVARLLGGRPDEIALFDNSTRAWHAAFYAVPLGPGDRILADRAGYGSNVLAYLHVARRTGAEVVVVPDDESGQLDVAALAALLDERTRLIAITHVPTGSGLVNPAAHVGRLARAADVLLILDATQSVGQFPVDVDQLGCDLLTGTGRKFLRGPRGTGFLWTRTGALDRLEPSVAELRSAAWVGPREFAWVDGARRFETWEHSYMNVLGLGSAARQALDLTMEAIGRRAVGLGARLRRQLEGVAGITTHDLGRQHCAIVTARVDGVPTAEVAAALARAGINVSETVPGTTPLDDENRSVHPLIRLSPHYYNTEDELDRAVEVMAGLARSD